MTAHPTHPSHGLSYSGIGSRSTPAAMLDQMRELSAELARMGFVLRSGGADGADMACEQGCDQAGGRKEIWLPWPGFQGRRPDPRGSTFLPAREAFELARTVHPAWMRLGPGPQALHARNAHQVLGRALDTPSAFVLCWTSDGAQTAQETNSKTGGTATAIRLASMNGIPVINLVRPDSQERLRSLLAELPVHTAADEEHDPPAAPVLRFPM